MEINLKNNRANKKAQGAIEFVILLAILLIFFVVFFSVIKINVEEKNLEKEKIIVQNIALSIQYEIDLATESSEGYYREFNVPENILGKDYLINLTESRVYVSLGKMGISYKVSKINGSIKKGTNIIKNQNETVVLN